MDVNLILRDGTVNLTVDETLTTTLVGPMVHPLWLHVLVPAVVAATTLDVELEFCALAAPTTEVYRMHMKQIGAVGYYSIPFYTILEHLQVKLDVTGTTPNFGGAKVWIAPAHRADMPYNA